MRHLTVQELLAMPKEFDAIKLEELRMRLKENDDKMIRKLTQVNSEEFLEYTYSI